MAILEEGQYSWLYGPEPGPRGLLDFDEDDYWDAHDEVLAQAGTAPPGPAPQRDRWMAEEAASAARRRLEDVCRVQ